MNSTSFKKNVRSRHNIRLAFIILVNGTVSEGGEASLPPLLSCVPNITEVKGERMQIGNSSISILPDVCLVSKSGGPMSREALSKFIQSGVSELRGTDAVLVRVSLVNNQSQGQQNAGTTLEMTSQSLQASPTGFSVHSGAGDGSGGGSAAGLQGSSDRQLALQSARLVLCGPSGIGKSHLAQTLLAMYQGGLSPFDLPNETLGGTEAERFSVLETDSLVVCRGWYTKQPCGSGLQREGDIVTHDSNSSTNPATALPAVPAPAPSPLPSPLSALALPDAELPPGSQRTQKMLVRQAWIEGSLPHRESRAIPIHTERLGFGVDEEVLEAGLRGADVVVVGNRAPDLINADIILSKLAALKLREVGEENGEVNRKGRTEGAAAAAVGV
uniref:Uncharacterized protein n=1 Tax=Chromera velia CCMP2878 TaxID=1169474 RepID=A0A0G4FL50_9ALVE|eukprot:Cvel_3438.t1-p1 / transcript=Cvel_3438.t1 / gene=Cvel_3438 / organism=Chromera_velia_CCMP2878 / gene_product=hypothetical protein / transcript_product=hypothetical protein / location=Cvel_scaffold138:78393-79728(+) / protein_length=385 / sequence_SO=supercontig / SO=protein_coding / is_pseudo=false